MYCWTLVNCEGLTVNASIALLPSELPPHRVDESTPTNRASSAEPPQPRCVSLSIRANVDVISRPTDRPCNRANVADYAANVGVQICGGLPGVALVSLA